MAKITGTKGNNILLGTDSADEIYGLEGNDIILAGRGDDVVTAGAGNDIADGGAGNDVINGDAGNDLLNGGAGNDTVNGGAGNDIVIGDAGNDTLDGGSDNDIVTGADGNDTLIYRISENSGDSDLYDGGTGTDKLRIFATAAQQASSAFQNDIALLQARIAHNGSATATLKSVGLTVTSIEQVEIVTVGSSNVPPTATGLSASETYIEDTPLNLADIVVADADSATVTVTLTLSNPVAGALSTATSGAVTSSYNAATGVWSATGATASVNALLAGVTFTPASNFNGNFTVATSVSDGVAPAVTGTKSFTGTAVNDAPTATGLSVSEAYTEDTPRNLTDIVVADVDSATVTVTLTLSNPLAGALSTASSGAVTSTYNPATGVWSANGAVASVNALLAGVTFTPATNFNGSFTIATSVSDGVAPAVTGSKSFTGTAVNDAPTATGLSAAEGYTEDNSLNLTDIVVADVDSATVTVTLTISNPLAGALSTANSGAVTSTYDAATGVWSASGATANVNALLAGVTFTPAANFNGSFTIATSVSDGVAPPVTGSKSVTGTAVNDAPVGVADVLAATEDTVITYTKAQLLGNDTDIDNTNGQLSIASVTSGTGGTAVLNPDGSVTFTPGANFNGQANFTYVVKDGALTSSPTAVTVNVAPVAAQPVITVERIEVNASTQAINLNIHIDNPEAGDTISTIRIEGVPDTYKLNHGSAEDGVWTVNWSDVPGLALLPSTVGSVGASGPITLEITATAFDHSSIASTTEELKILVKNLNEKRAVDGYIADALVFVDADQDGNLDDGELFTYTAPDGTFSLDASGGPLVLMGVQEGIGGHNTVDVLTGLPFTATLKAPTGSTVVTPLTNLIVTIAGPGANAAATQAAEASVKAALGLTTTDSLTTLDPIAGTVSDAPGASEVLAASIQVQATVAQLSAATGATADQVIGALAQAVNNSSEPGSVDLGVSSTVSTLASAVNDALPAGQQLSSAELIAVTAVVSESNTQISTGLSDGADLNDVAQAATVAFGGTTQALSDAANGVGGTTFDDVESEYTGAALTDKIANAPLTLTGTDVADTLVGGVGDDTLSGAGGKDLLTGGDGNDSLDGGADFDRASYTDATGGIIVNLGLGTVTGAGVGSDTLIAVDGIIGSDYNDHFDTTGFTGTTGLPGAIIGFSEFEGRGGDDEIIGARNVQNHALTRVSYLGASAGVTVDIRDGEAFGTDAGDIANVGHDTISNILNVWGSNHDDILRGSDNGQGSFEAYEGRRGNDFIDGRGGYDVVVYATDTTTATGITVNLAAGTVTGDATVGTDTLRQVEAVRGTRFNDTYDATNFGAANTANIGSLGTFNDFHGGGGDDTVIGNGGTRVNFSSALAGVSVNLQTNLNQAGVTATNVVGSATGATEGTDTLTGVNAAQGSQFNDTLLGSNFNNTFTGLGGDDFIDGRGGFDTASYNSMTLATAGVTVMMAAGTVTDEINNVTGHDTLRSIEGVQGTHFNDTYNATGFGAAGVDPLTNNVGNNGNFNQFEGLGGNDAVTGNNNTRLLYTNATAGVTVTFAGSFSGTAVGADASVGTDTFSGVNSVTGSGFADSITGDNNNNIFDGGAGGDTINGGGGSDTITGGAGNDTINGGGGTDMAVYSATFETYTLDVTSPGTGTISGPDGADSFSGIEVLQFSNRYQMVAVGAAGAGNSINVTGLNFGGNANTFFGTSTGNDFLTIGQNLGGHQIDLQGGTDTLLLGVTGGYSLNLANVENLVGTAGDDFVGLTGNANGLAIDLGAGSNDGVNLANGLNTVSVVNVENLNGSDFAPGTVSNDTLTLANNVSGLSVNLANGDNTLNLAAGGSSFTNLFNVQHVNGTASDDVLSISNGFFEPGNNPIVDLGAGDNTLNLGAAGITLTALNVQHLNGNGLDNFFTLMNNVNGMAVDLGGGTNDSLTLANGSNSLSALNIENIGSADFSGPASNDTLQLLGNVGGGVSVNLQQGFNTLNLAAGANTFENIFNVDAINGSGSDDQLVVNSNLGTANNDLVINLGGGEDTLTVGGGFLSFGLVDTEHLTGSAQDNFVTLSNTVSGLAVDLGGGANDGLTLASGVNSLSLAGVESLQTSDFAGAAVDDTVTLLNAVSGLSVNLQQGSNTLNLADGSNSVSLHNVQTISGTASASNDTLTILNGIGNATIDLGAGIDTLNLSSGSFGLTVDNVENINGSADNDTITIGTTTGPTTVTGGLGADFVTAGAGQDIIRFTSAAESTGGSGIDSVNNFDVATDRIALDHVAGLASEVHFVSGGVFTGSPADRHSEARLSGNLLEIDVDGDGQIGAGDIQLFLNGLNGPLSDANFVSSGVNHAPTNISLAGSSVAENSAAGTVVGALSGTDPDAGDGTTFSLVNPSGMFAINGNDLVVAGAIDYEAAASQQVTVRVTDAGGLSYDETFTVTVTDVNEAPTVTSGATATVAENTATSTVVYQAMAADPDGTAPHNAISWSLTGADAGAFSIDSSGQVRLNSSADYETRSSYSINVVATDGGNLSSSQTVTVSVTDANDAPLVTSGATGSVAENASISTVVYQAIATDPDAGAPHNTITWSLTGADAAAFTIDPGGQVRLNSSANYEAKSSYSIDVVATDGGNLSSSKAVTINVTDVNEAPTDIALSNASVDENSAAATVVGTLSSTDPDAGSSATYTLVNDAGGRFAVSGNTLVVAGNLDYESNASHQVTVRVNDGGLTYDETFTIAVNNLGEGEILGDDNNNSLPGTSGNDVIRALGGDDDLTGFAGDDTLYGGAGQDIAIYSDATAAITISMAAGTVTSTSADAGIGTDTLRSIEIVRGSNFDDTYNATGYWTGVGAPTGANLGSATLPGPINNTFDGGDGNDTVTGNGRTTVAYRLASAGVTVTMSTSSNPTVAPTTLDVNGTVTSTAGGNAAGIGTDTLINVNWARGSEYDDVFNGGSGNDVFIGGGGNDAMNGGIGFDLANYTPATNNTATAGLSINMTTGIVTGNASVGVDTLRSIESVRGTVFADTYTATNFGAMGFTNPANFNVGNNGTFNEFEGMDGDDIIVGNNNTRIMYYNASGAVTVDLLGNGTNGFADGDASVGHDTLSGIAQVRGSSFDDHLYGTNTVAFSEVFDGWTGNDYIDGRGGFDTVQYNNNGLTASGITVDMAAGTVVGDSTVGTDTLRGIEQVFGTNHADTYNASQYGMAGANNNMGLPGLFNSFQGLGGNDTITGNGNTQLIYGNATGPITVTFSSAGAGTVTGNGSVGTDTFTGVNNIQGSNSIDTFTGSAGNEVFGGGGGNDSIDGGAGSDAITGGAGNDMITGGAGGDMAVFTAGVGSYTITLGTGTVSTGGADGTDTLTGIELLQFADGYRLIASGSAGNSIDASGLFLSGPAALTTMTGSSDDYLTIGTGFGNRQVNLGGGNDTITLGVAGGYGLNLASVETVVGSGGNDFLSLMANAAGLVVDLGDGTDNLSLAGGLNSLSITGVEGISGSDFGPTGPVVNDQLTLQNQVSGVNISLGNGDNTMNLAAGSNSFTNIFDVNHVNGTTSDDVLTVSGTLAAANGTTVDLGAGEDTLVFAGTFATLSAVGIEHINGSASDNTLGLTNLVDGIAIDMGDGIDTVSLANGANSLSIIGVEHLTGSDFGGPSTSDDTVTLLNAVSGVDVNLGSGTNTLNIAAGSSSFDNLFGVNLVNGSSSDDTLTFLGSAAPVIDLGDGADTVTFGTSAFNVTVANTENINASSNFDIITIDNAVTGSTTITAGAGADVITASAGQDNFRFASTADSAAGGTDTIHNFDAASDAFVLSGIDIAGGHIEFVDGGSLLGSDQASARLQNFGPGNDQLQIDVDGDGLSDMDISLQNLQGTLDNSSFHLT